MEGCTANLSGTSLATLRVQGPILTCGTRQVARELSEVCHAVCSCSVLPCVLLIHCLAERAHKWASVCCGACLFPLCVHVVLLAVQHINLREGNFPVAHWLISLCLYIQLHWTSCSVGAVFRYLFLMFLLLFFFHSSVIQASGSSDSQHTCPACKYLKGSYQTLGPFSIFFTLQIFHGAAGLQK